ncbi:putative transcriptional regulator [Clostridium tetanomorphum]|nr:hypothetical protein [Clostridium tetanomorphum]MBP1864119.1 putative transcriptional regulator [Clostridium tetanomorphum]NRS84532.1 putative transcriptional regulator [Clostridium tetanomorphum]NRZ97746.1 putative transcriptional regulator [Clostridium tetanomorphum]SQB91972.1 Uncharacterised protein [Clostridium tetanomorphum]
MNKYPKISDAEWEVMKAISDIFQWVVVSSSMWTVLIFIIL